MRNLLRRLARRLAPTAYTKLERLTLMTVDEEKVAVDRALLERIRDLEVQLKEVRQDHRRVTELYDLMFERLRQDNPLTVGK